MSKKSFVTFVSLLLCSCGPLLAQSHAQVWCTQHHPCDWTSHTGAVLAGSMALDLVTPLEASQSRWIVAGYYLQREVRSLARFGPGHPDTNEAFGLPLWIDSVIDMSFVGLGVWLAPKMPNASLWGNRITVQVH